MVKTNSRLLDTGDPFPAMTLALTTGRTIVLPGDLGPGYGVLLLYRGHW
jgi:peroxiredoxin